MSWLQLAGKQAIVTGAASGIGKATAKTLHAAGCRLILVDTNKDEIENLSTLWSAVGVECDVSSQSQVDSLFSSISQDSTILVNCAGITRDNFLSEMTEQDWDKVVDVNLKGTFNMCQWFLHNRFLNDNEASIVNLGSVVSETGNHAQVNYAASKGGVVGLTRALAKEVAKRGIRVNAVLPGYIETPMTQAVPKSVIDIIKKKIPLQGRLGKPEDVANVIAFLASDRSCYITGETIECSGMIAL